MKSELENSLAPVGEALPEIGAAFSGGSLLLLALFYIALVAFYLLSKRSCAGRAAGQNSMEVLGQLVIGKRERIVEVATGSGTVIVAFSENGVAITEAGKNEKGKPTFQTVLQAKEVGAA